MKYFLLFHFLFLPLVGGEAPGCQSEGLEIVALKAKIASLQIDLDIMRNPLVMRAKLAEYDAQVRLDAAKAAEEERKKNEKAPSN